ALSCRSGADVARAFLGAGLSAAGCHAAVPHSNAMGGSHAPRRPGRQPATGSVLLLHAVLIPAAGAVGTVGRSKIRTNVLTFVNFRKHLVASPFTVLRKSLG